MGAKYWVMYPALKTEVIAAILLLQNNNIHIDQKLISCILILRCCSDISISYQVFVTMVFLGHWLPD